MTLYSIQLLTCVVVLRDRKRKKFVGQSGQDTPRQKRIKTESGHWIRASYKSNAYREWKGRHNIDTPIGGQEEEGCVTGSGEGQRLGPKRGPHNRFRQNKQWRQHVKGEVGDLKPKADILKKRHRKEIMDRRKKLKRGKGQRNNSKYGTARGRNKK